MPIIQNKLKFWICVRGWDTGHCRADNAMYTCEKCCGCIQHYYTHSLINLHQLQFATPTDTFEPWHLVSCLFLYSSWHYQIMASVSIYFIPSTCIVFTLCLYSRCYGIRASMQHIASVNNWHGINNFIKFKNISWSLSFVDYTFLSNFPQKTSE